MSHVRPITALMCLLVPPLLGACTEEQPDPPFVAASTTVPCVPSGAGGFGAVWGTVSDADGQPARGAQVFFEALGVCGALTDSLGRYTITDIPSGHRRLHVRTIGYLAEEFDIRLDNDTVHLSVRLTPVAARLDHPIERTSPDTTSAATPDTVYRP